MREFCTKGWEHYGKCTSIMYLSTAHGGHVFHPTAATKPVPDEDEEDSIAVDPPSGSSIIIGSSSSIVAGPEASSLLSDSSTAAMAVDDSSVTSVNPAESFHSAHPAEPSHSSTKRSQSLMTSESEPASSLSIPPISTVSASESAQTSTTPLSSFQQPAKRLKGSKHSGISGQSATGTAAAPSGKVTPATAVVGMQGSINRLTNIFERNMTRNMAEDPVTASHNRTIGLVQEQEDGLTTDQKIVLISCFMGDIVAANTYISLVDARQGWILTMLSK